MAVAGKSILIVEDDPVARQVWQGALRKAGYTVAVAPDALSALPQARAAKPDLVILDLGLPAGGGFTVMQRLQSFPATTGLPVLVISGQERAANEQRALDAGAAAYLQKPVSPDQVVQAVKDLLDGMSSPFTE